MESSHSCTILGQDIQKENISYQHRDERQASLLTVPKAIWNGELIGPMDKLRGYGCAARLRKSKDLLLASSRAPIQH